MSMNPIQFGNSPSWSSSGQQPVYPVYPFNDQQAARSSIVPSQMQGNASFPWIFHIIQCLFLILQYIHLMVHLFIQVPFFPMAVSSSVSQVPPIPPVLSTGPSDVTAISNVPMSVPQTAFGLPIVNPPGNSTVSQPVSAAYVQSSVTVGPSRLGLIERPSFPCFKSNDSQEFAMLNMALKNLVSSEETEQYKYHILDHLKLDAARHLALAYAHDPQPYTTALKALQRKYGQPHH